MFSGLYILKSSLTSNHLDVLPKNNFSGMEANTSVFMVHTCKVGDLGSTFYSSQVKRDNLLRTPVSRQSICPTVPNSLSGESVL